MLTIFMLMQASREWLTLAVPEREKFVAGTLGPVFARYPGVQVKFYDAEAFHAQCSDIAVFEIASIEEYTAFIDELRNSPLYTVPYFTIVDIIPTQQADFI